MINKELNAKVFFLVVSAAIAGAFIEAITEAIKNSISILKIWWFFMVPIFAIIDLIVCFKTGEEIITWILEEMGVNFE